MTEGVSVRGGCVSDGGCVDESVSVKRECVCESVSVRDVRGSVCK